jgi:hypothetical protein
LDLAGTAFSSHKACCTTTRKRPDSLDVGVVELLSGGIEGGMGGDGSVRGGDGGAVGSVGGLVEVVDGGVVEDFFVGRDGGEGAECGGEEEEGLHGGGSRFMWRIGCRSELKR